MGNRDSSPPIQPSDDHLFVSKNFVPIPPPITPPTRSASPENIKSNDSLTPVIEEKKLEEIHINVSAKIITEQMLIEIYNDEKNRQNNKNNQISDNQKNTNVINDCKNKNKPPAIVCLVGNDKSNHSAIKTNSSNHQSLLSFVFNGFVIK